VEKVSRVSQLRRRLARIRGTCEAAMLLVSVASCGSSGSATDGEPSAPVAAVPEKICGESPTTQLYVPFNEGFEMYAGCTVLVGYFQLDSVSKLPDFAPLKDLRKLEGRMNIFRSGSFVTLHGLENLELVEGNLSIHLNWNLTSLRALEKLEQVTGNLHVASNDLVPQADLDWLGAKVQVGGTKTLNDDR
jgi:hypothetical protein